MRLAGLGVGWRPELALAIERRVAREAAAGRPRGAPRLKFVELLAEDFFGAAPLPEPIERLRDLGIALVPHGVGLSLGGAEPPDPRRLDALARLAERTGAPLVSEHLAFVRAGDVESGHLLPLPRTRAALEVLVENVRIAQAALPVPLALENVAALFDWPGAEMDEARFLAEALERTGARLLLDLANVHANARNRGLASAGALLDGLPLERVAYVHVAGGVERDGLYHDTHAHPLAPAVLDLVAALAARIDPPGVLLERDDRFADREGLDGELDRIAAAIARGAAARMRYPEEVARAG